MSRWLFERSRLELATRALIRASARRLDEAHSGELALHKRKRRRASRSPAAATRSGTARSYGITDKGETRLRELLVDADSSDDRAFHVQVAFCRFLEPIAGSAYSSGGGPT